MADAALRTELRHVRWGVHLSMLEPLRFTAKPRVGQGLGSGAVLPTPPHPGTELQEFLKFKCGCQGFYEGVCQGRKTECSL